MTTTAESVPEAVPNASAHDAILKQHPRFSTFAWVVYWYILFVILFGAWVRITGSGAGCGEHWPTCNGEVVPLSPSRHTIIEYTHRVTSGLLGPAVLALCAWSWFGAGRRRVTRWLTSVTAVFVVLEALIGAGLVLGGLVASNTSSARALVVALHLANTLVLISSSSAAAWLGKGRALPALGRRYPGRSALLWCIGMLLLVCMSGAVTALGDTLFPVQSRAAHSLGEHLVQGLRSDVHFLVRLRVLHPLLAIGAGFFGIAVLQRWENRARELGWLSRWTARLLWLQLGLGSINIVLAAPPWLQLLHLLVAEWVWTGLTLTLVAAQADA